MTLPLRIIDNSFAKYLITDIRNQETPREVLRERLFELGRLTSEEIIGDNLISENVITPMGVSFAGYSIPRNTTVVISTRDDYHFFAKGLQSRFPNSYKGYMDFGGERGPDALQNKRRAIEFPTIKQGDFVETLVVAKSVLATGCTAITLTKTAIARYQPKKVIIASVFYSKQGITDLLSEIPRIDKIYTHGEPDDLNDEGLLMPGVGDLDSRITEQFN